MLIERVFHGCNIELELGDPFQAVAGWDLVESRGFFEQLALFFPHGVCNLFEFLLHGLLYRKKRSRSLSTFFCRMETFGCHENIRWVLLTIIAILRKLSRRILVHLLIFSSTKPE